jgi:hypothetical protein
MTDAAPPQESKAMAIGVNIFVAAILLMPLVLVGAGGWLLYQRQFGEKVEAEVLTCDFDINYRSSAQYCTARWTEDGVEMTGPIHASGDQEVGKTITATVRDGELYSRSLALPLILIGLGLPFCYFPYAWVRRRIGSREVEDAVG